MTDTPAPTTISAVRLQQALAWEQVVVALGPFSVSSEDKSKTGAENVCDHIRVLQQERRLRDMAVHDLKVAKDRIERLLEERDHWKANHDRMKAVKQAVLERPDLADRAAKVQQLVTDLEEESALREKLGSILTRTTAALKGPPPPRTLHDWSDLPKVATRLKAIVDAARHWNAARITFRNSNFDITNDPNTPEDLAAYVDADQAEVELITLLENP